MTVPAWRPMPKTEEDPSEEGYRKGALIRARHRTLMALRWRSKEARDEDKKARRLPDDWHEWMGCPGVDQGYGSPPCTCDQKLSTHPRAVRERERETRKRLSAELKFSFKERKLAKEEGRELVAAGVQPLAGVVWVKTIDTASSAPTIENRGRPSYGIVKNLGVSEVGSRPIARYPSTPAARSDSPSVVSTRAVTKRLKPGVRIRLPAWITAGGRALSYLLGGCRAAR
jgi:hypothetical protein